MDKLELKTVKPGHVDLSSLIEKLDGYLSGLYPQDEIFGVDLSDPKSEEMTFVLAYWEGVPVGCGGIRRIDERTVELKRFFVEPAMRRQGVARQVFRYLEQEAEKQGCTVMRLETGAPQFESVNFYKKQGFYEIERFGEYVNCESSLCMEKVLA
ncbi:GNAT family N-acetyltransferase [Paenibacillus soyae]|uniref:GNAT family N-acetyltransferase n=1 Tax=Paenibacillus soyae TaxID=2969249 RepID=A0A9X2MPP4_9BACL|nr:GNAT family N-acetyltransferase [Paenibacillus soyae]MCR2803583.1 GNAT family N-acetyltransferase [Paenibacillus soyae]